MSARRLTLTLLAMLALLTPASALARRKASKIERQRVIVAAVAAGHINTEQGTCVRVWISSVDRHWASVSFPWPTSKRCQALTANGVILLHWRRGTWRVVTDGSDFRCPIKRVPRPVSHDLKIVC